MTKFHAHDVALSRILFDALMLITDWEEFFEKSKALFMNNPNKTRYTMKYRHSDCAMILKVTDDIVCLNFKTDQQSDMKHIEKLSNFFFEAMSSKKLDQLGHHPATESKEEQQKKPGKKGRRKRET